MEVQKLENVIPTCISCSERGNLVAVGYTDEKIRIIDVRVKGGIFEMQG